MIVIPKYKGKEFPDGNPVNHNYAVESYDDYLIKVRNIPNYVEHRLRDSAGGHPTCAFSLGDINNKPMILIDGCMHKSHEWRASYWIKHFMEVIESPELHYPALTEQINELKSMFSFYFIPVLGPDSFVSSAESRYIFGNENGVDINRNFDFKWEESTHEGKGPAPFSEAETKNLRDVILDYKPVAYINTHGWGNLTGFLAGQMESKKLEVLTHDIYKSIAASTDVPMDTDVRYSPHIDGPLSYNWVSQQESANGQNIISLIYEVGTSDTTKTQSTYGVTGLLLKCLHVQNYLINGELVMTD